MALIGEMHYLTIGGNTYSLPSGGDGTITRVKTTAGTHSAIDVSSGAANFNVPTKTSHLTNDSGFLTSHQTLYEANLNWGGKDFSASYGPVDAAMIDVLGANRFAFLKAAGLTIEYSTNGGSSYTDYGATDAQKVGLFSNGQAFYLGKHSTAGSCTTNDRLRVTIATSAASIYTALNKIAIYMSTQGSTVQVLIEKALESTPTTFVTHKDWTGISGWSGWNILNISSLTTYGNTAASQYGRIRFTFRATAVNTTYSAALITKIQGYGGQGWTVPSNMAASGHLYSYDSAQNAYFPAQVTATYFNGPLNGNASSATTAGKISDLGSSDNASSTATWRKVWFSYEDGVTGRPALKDSLTFQTSTGTLKATAFSGNLTGNVTGTATGNLTSVQYDSTNAKLTYTKNGSNTDIVTVATLKSALGSMPASDVYSWAKASTKPTYTASEVGAAASSHAHGNITSGGDITATAPTIANGDQIVINDSSASKITNGPTFDGSTTTTALTPKGTWESFSKFSGSYNDLTNKPTIPTVPSNVSAFTNDAGYITSADVPEGASAYTGTISAVSTTASNGTSNGFARGDHVHNITGTVVKSALGTGSGTTKFLREDGSWATPAYTTNTDAKLQVAAVTSGTTYYPIVGTGTTAATRQYDTTGFIYKGTNGTTSAVGSAQLTLGNSTASGTANNKQGQLILYGSTAYAHTICGAPTAHRTITFPDKTGTVALTSDIPSSAANSTAGISISNHSTSNIGSASGWSAGSASTWAFEEVSIPNVTAAGSASTWTFEEKTIPNVTAAGSGSFTSGAFSGGSGSFSATVTSHVLSFSHTHTAATHGADSHTHTAPTIGTAIKVQSKSGGGNGTAPTIGTAIKVQSKKSGSNSTVPSLTVTSTAVVTGTSHTITDNGHTHTLS